MQTFSLDSDVVRGLVRRRIARRLNGYGLVALVVFFTVEIAVGLESKLTATLFLSAFVVHGAAATYMRFAKCPRCRQFFAEQNALWYFTSLEDQLTVRCHNCGLPLCA